MGINERDKSAVIRFDVDGQHIIIDLADVVFCKATETVLSVMFRSGGWQHFNFHGGNTDLLMASINNYFQFPKDEKMPRINEVNHPGFPFDPKQYEKA